MQRLRHAYVDAVGAVVGAGADGLRLVDLAIRHRERGARREVRGLDVACHVDLLAVRQRVEARRGDAGARRHIDQHAFADLLAIGDAEVAPHVARLDVQAVPEMLEAVVEDDAHRRVGGAHAADGGEAIVAVLARDDAERVGVARQQVRVVGPDHDARQHVRPLLVVHLVHAADHEGGVFAQLPLGAGARRPLGAVQPEAAGHAVVDDEGRDQLELGVRGEVGGAEGGIAGVAQALLGHAQRHADAAAAGLQHGGVAGDLDQIGARRRGEEVLLAEVADLHAGVVVLPLEVVRADVRVLLVGRKVLVETPP